MLTNSLEEVKIRESLLQFVKKHISESADLSTIDEIALSYVIALLEDTKSSASSSSCNVFNVQDFCELMSAYFPDFQTINPAAVYQWFVELQASLMATTTTTTDLNSHQPNRQIQLPPLPPTNSTNRSHAYEEPKPTAIGTVANKKPSIAILNGGDVALLQEIFPAMDLMEIRQCLTVGEGDMARATQLLIDRQETANQRDRPVGPPQNDVKIGDDELKNRIIERYSYVDPEAALREYRPMLPRVEPKKMVRYRDNKIVSLKGERYTEVKKGEDVMDISLKRSGQKTTASTTSSGTTKYKPFNASSSVGNRP